MFISPYGLMKTHLLRQWAALQMNDAKSAEKELAFMRQHQADDYRGFQEALVAAGRVDEAMRLMSFRLSSVSMPAIVSPDAVAAVHVLSRFRLRACRPVISIAPA